MFKQRRIVIMTAETLLISKQRLISSMDAAKSNYRIAALTKTNDDRYVYDYIGKGDDIEFEYHPTVIPPKKFLFLSKETLFEFSDDGKIKSELETTPTILFGIRPCDLNAIKILNEAFADHHGDPNYLARLEKTLVIGMECTKVCDEHAFCYRTGSQNAKGGYDIMLYPDGDNFAVKSVTDKGKKFVTKYLTKHTANIGADDFINEVLKKKEQAFSKEKLFPNLDKMPEIFAANSHHPIWEQEGSKCLSCGSCIMTCPTCYCFDVRDEVALNMQHGKRQRVWDGCMLDTFAVVAGGANFRGSQTDRLHHRINRKFNWLVHKHGQSVCVGCGRCVRACLAKISPKTIGDAILADAKLATATVDVPLDAHKADRDLYLPMPAKIVACESFTEQEKHFKLELENGKSLGHDAGQFVQISILGVGEAPISLASPPDNTPTFDICVRKVGDVTNKLHTMNVGDTVHVRGPFGHGFTPEIMEKMRGKHLLFIAGGIGYVPLRSLINQVVANQHDYEKITILYGCKTPSERMFPKELSHLAKIGGKISIAETVDQAEEGWTGNVGVITTLIPPIDLDPTNTIAVIVGPPIMYKFVLKSLTDKHITADNIYVSLERRMKCGVGKCGHCQMSGIYVCQDGPVFKYADIKDNEEVF
ncbi:MAG: 4Fe-4S dicluster domain-containing protein [Gammaproteobacteria bacterium]|nr:4Fe-4S dicluster domain-containing protein [Gammaproteobacteria bacterium]